LRRGSGRPGPRTRSRQASLRRARLDQIAAYIPSIAHRPAPVLRALGLEWRKLRYGFAPLGDHDRLARLADFVKQAQARLLELAGGNRLHEDETTMDTGYGQN
jgi:hypothetical protein